MDVVCMLWRRPDRDPAQLKKRYGGDAVRSLRAMLDRCSGGAARLVCVTNLPEEAVAADEVIELPDGVARLPSQYPKLWLFSSEFAATFGRGRRFLFTDLDVVLLRDPRPLLDEAGPVRFRSNYADVADAPSARRRLVVTRADVEGRRAPPYSTSLFAMTAGLHGEVWTRFSVRRARRIVGWTGTDQKWVNWVLGPDAPRWPVDARFVEVGRALDDPTPPGPEAIVVTCSHRLSPWDDEIRSRLPWLADAYPVG